MASSVQDVGSFIGRLEPARIKPYGRVAQRQRNSYLDSPKYLSSQFTKDRINLANTLLYWQGPCVALVHVQKNNAISSYLRGCGFLKVVALVGRSSAGLRGLYFALPPELAEADIFLFEICVFLIKSCRLFCGSSYWNWGCWCNRLQSLFRTRGEHIVVSCFLLKF
jgi:hypothetical protein